MRHLIRRSTDPARRGAAAVELAIVLPMVMFLVLIGTDFARVFYFAITVQNCARNGAIFACDPVVSSQSPYKTTEEAALADASNLTGATVSSTSGAGYVEVTVHYTFKTITQFPGIPDTVMLARTVRMRSLAAVPNFQS